MQVIALEENGHGLWQKTLDMIQSLCDGQADLGYDYRDAGGWKLPCVDFRLDAPAELLPPVSREEDGACVDLWQHGAVVLGMSVPAQLQAETVWLLPPNGASAVIYRAFRRSVALLRQLGLPVEFSWSSVPLAPQCDDLSLLLRREEEFWQLGSVHTVWLRCEDPENLKDILRTLPPSGQVRVQEMRSANTWVQGILQEAELVEKLKKS